MSALLMRGSEPDWGALFWIAIFVGGPLLLRLARFLKERLEGTLTGTSAPSGEAEARRRAARAALQQSEAEGSELWRRLARGEEAARAPGRPGPSRPQPTPPPARAPLGAQSKEFEPIAPAEMSTVTEPGEILVVSEEREEEPEALGALDVANQEPGRRKAQELWKPRSRSRWGRALVFSEVLATPVCDNPLREIRP